MCKAIVANVNRTSKLLCVCVCSVVFCSAMNGRLQCRPEEEEEEGGRDLGLGCPGLKPLLPTSVSHDSTQSQLLLWIQQREPEGAEWAYHSYHFSDNGRHIKDDPANSTNAKVAQLATMHFIQFPKGKCFQAVIMYSHCPPRVTRQPALTSVRCRGRHDSAGKKKNREKNEPWARSLCL